MNKDYKLYPVTSCAYCKIGEVPAHDPPNDPPSRYAWVWSEGAQKWGLTPLQNANLDVIASWPEYQIEGQAAPVEESAAPVRNKRERKAKTKNGSNVVVWMATLILMVLFAINNKNSPNNVAQESQNQVAMLVTPAFQPAPPLVEKIPEEYVTPALPAICTGEGVALVPATLENQTYTIDPESKWVPKPGETYCIADPDLFWRAFLADSKLEDLKAFDISGDSSFRDGGSILRRYITAFSSKYRMSVKSADKGSNFFKRWNEAWYMEFVNKIEAYLANPSDDSKFVVTFPSEAPIDNVDMDRLVKQESLPVPQKVGPTPFQPKANTPTLTPEVVYIPPTATLMPTMELQIVPTVQRTYPTATYVLNPGGQDLTWSDTSVQDSCITAIGSVDFRMLYQQAFWNDGVTTRLEFRWEDDGYLHAYGNRVTVGSNINGNSVCILQITGSPDRNNVDGRGSVWLGTNARLYAAYGAGDGTWNGSELKVHGIWLGPITQIGSGYGNPTPVPIPTSTPYPGNVSLAGYIGYLNTTGLYWTTSCGVVGTIGTMTQSSDCNGQRYVDFGEVWDLIDASKGILIVGKCDSAMNDGSYKMSKYQNTIWCYGPVK
ncbi:hypothetical protein COW83_00635 [Candidatus Collierbacteria bacterium CG22_combo_CG10-13_8_21_14_all_43_12]|uniref:Uncharacterized protein n=1 Tax=Candidatus Collierbacteria bacterium CG22_combo_CG10-13_8_21_14_all_43_12 TaxID=1974537 RepID=A0A2H0DVE3_9BACT|nr:MAG: hypothetical protein COW83_00635 [Candidatus Collierbacteria bacterium CG22_combo_CG10-13_8_21_14_all_43_12]